MKQLGEKKCYDESDMKRAHPWRQTGAKVGGVHAFMLCSKALRRSVLVPGTIGAPDLVQA